MDSVACSKQVPTSYLLEMSTWPCWRTGRQFDTLGTAVDNLKSQRIRIDEPAGGDRRRRHCYGVGGGGAAQAFRKQAFGKIAS